MPIENLNAISWDAFARVALRAGTIIAVESFPEARKPAYKVTVDFGPEIGIKKTSAQITALYTREELVGKQIIGVVNLAPKQIGPFMSEFLLTGFHREDGAVVLAGPGIVISNGAKLS